MTQIQLSAHLLLQLAAILCFCRLVGLVGKRLGQPQAVCEMVAGLLMGPSCLGILVPSLQSWLFPPESRTILHVVAQLGLVLYMFIVGATLRLDLALSQARIALIVSLAGIIAPFALGAALAWSLYQHSTLFVEGVSFPATAMFLGAALSITAFPILARIIEDQGLRGTRLGALAITAASLDDVLAWIALAAVLACVSSDSAAWFSWMTLVKPIGGGIAFVLVTIFVIRPFMSYVEDFIARRPESNRDVRTWPMKPAAFSLILVLLALATWTSDYIGLHAVFGAFTLGLAMPRGQTTQFLERMIVPLATTLLLPLFFVSTGLNTRVTLINTWSLVFVSAAFIIVACASKFVACAIAARLGGVSMRESLGLGALMNARGMTGLIVFNIGLERGILSPTLFTIGVLTAVLTTVAATPAFKLCMKPGQ